MSGESITFGLYTLRDDDDVVDDIFDALDDILGKDAEYDLIAWRRNSGTKILVHAPLIARNLVYDDDLEMRSLSVMSVINDAKRGDNEWIEPVASRKRSASDIAISMIKEWTDHQWSRFEDDESTEVTHDVDDSAEDVIEAEPEGHEAVDLSVRRSRRQRQESKAQDKAEVDDSDHASDNVRSIRRSKTQSQKVEQPELSAVKSTSSKDLLTKLFGSAEVVDEDGDAISFVQFGSDS